MVVANSCITKVPVAVEKDHIVTDFGLLIETTEG